MDQQSVALLEKNKLYRGLILQFSTLLVIKNLFILSNTSRLFKDFLFVCKLKCKINHWRIQDSDRLLECGILWRKFTALTLTISPEGHISDVCWPPDRGCVLLS